MLQYVDTLRTALSVALVQLGRNEACTGPSDFLFLNVR